MSIIGLEVFDRSVRKTNFWLQDLLSLIGGEDRHRADIDLRAGLRALRDRLGLVSAAQFAAQLPIGLRGIFFAVASFRNSTGEIEKIKRTMPAELRGLRR